MNIIRWGTIDSNSFLCWGGKVAQLVFRDKVQVVYTWWLSRKLVLVFLQSGYSSPVCFLVIAEVAKLSLLLLFIMSWTTVSDCFWQHRCNYSLKTWIILSICTIFSLFFKCFLELLLPHFISSEKSNTQLNRDKKWWLFLFLLTLIVFIDRVFLHVINEI